jgi:hypothetical protein
MYLFVADNYCLNLIVALWEDSIFTKPCQKEWSCNLNGKGRYSLFQSGMLTSAFLVIRNQGLAQELQELSAEW